MRTWMLDFTLVISGCLFAISCVRDKTSSQSGIKLVNGTPITSLSPSDRKTWSSAVILAFNMNPCSASHLGGGVFLTAAHCLDGNYDLTQNRSLDIFDANVHPLLSEDSILDKWEVLLPDGHTIATKRDSFGREIKVPQPDILVVRPKSGIDISSFNKLSRVSIAFTRNPNLATQLAGYGCIDLNHPENGSKMRMGTTSEPTLTDDRYVVEWTPGTSFVAGCAGDSGGPAVQKDSSGKLIQYGVIIENNIRRNPADPKNILSASTEFLDLGHSSIRPWLQRIIASIPPPPDSQ